MKSIRSVWHKCMYIFDRHQKLRLIGLLLMLFFETILELVGVISVYPFIALILSPSMIETNRVIHWLYCAVGVEDTNQFFVLVALLIIILYVVKNVYNALASYIRYGFVFNTQRELGVRLMRSYMKEPYSFFLEKNSSVLMRGVSSDVNQFFEMVFQCLYLFSDGVMLIVFGVFLLYLDFILSIVIVGIMILFVLVFVRWNKKRATHYGMETQTSAGKMTQWLQQAFGGAKEIKILRREEYFVDNYEKYCRITNKMNQRFSFLNAIPHLVLECFCTAAILLVISLRIQSGEEVVAFVSKMSVFAMALFRLFPRISRINTSVNAVIFSYPFLDTVFEDIKMGEEHKYIRKERQKIGEIEGKLEFNNEIRIENVHFSYPNTDEEVLSDVSLTIKKGQAIGLVGPSGSGKSTLADVLLGILELNEGRVLCDGEDILYHIDEWSDKLGYIPQTIFLSDDTIRNNVAFGLLEEATNDDMVWKALEQAQLKEFVENLPEGLDTRIGERGVRFSGGQRQRIGIARALYNNPEILVLDEATSALDNETERAVMESIERLLGHKTMIIIAHRITTVRNCDVIFKVEGRNAHPISYEELVKDVDSVPKD